MIKFKWRGEKDPKKWSALIRLERNVERNSTEFLKEARDFLIADIRSSWTRAAPSNPFEYPALDTTNLDLAIMQAGDDATLRDEKGRFAGTKGKFITIRFAAAEGELYHGRGEYIQALEFGREGAEPRPFIQVSVDRLRRVFPELARKKIRKR